MRGVSNLGAFINYIVFVIPILLIYVAGVILSIVFRQRLGKAAKFAISAFLIFLVNTVISVASQTVYFFYFLPSNNFANITLMLRVVGIVNTFLSIVAFILLFIALFANRNEVVSNEPPIVSFN